MGENMNKRTSDGLADLLKRHGIEPTYNSALDVGLARVFMPEGYNEKHKKQLPAQKTAQTKKGEKQ